MDQTQQLRGYIVDLRFGRTSLTERPSLALTLRASLGSESSERTVVFEGVSDLCVIDLNTLADCLLVVEDVRHWQHDGVHYAVRDVEDEVISFKCRGWGLAR